MEWSRPLLFDRLAHRRVFALSHVPLYRLTRRLRANKLSPER
jgi:hypothetical protein